MNISLPAHRVSSKGEHVIDHRAIFALAFPLILNSTIQAVLNLTDTWFVGCLSANATAALSVVTWPTLCFILLLGGVGMAVQTMAAQAFGAKQYADAGHYVWLGIFSAVLMIPVFYVIALMAKPLFYPFGLPEHVMSLVAQWWKPRMEGGALSVIFGAMTGFLNAINRTRLTLLLTLLVALSNIPCNYFFMFYLHMGIAGSAWGTNAALLLACLAGFSMIFFSSCWSEFYMGRTWKPRWSQLKQLNVMGIGIGIMISIDLLGYSLFQLMQAKLGVVEGAATQIVMSLTSIAYFPVIGMSMAGTTLVGQAIGAGARQWAYRLGNGVMKYIVAYMVLMSFVFVLFAHPLSQLFVSADVHSAEVAVLVTKLLCIAAVYQVFDGLNIGASFCLRGCGDFKVPARIVTCESLFVFVPLAHIFTFNIKQVWVSGLPQMGWGVVGGWYAVVIHAGILGLLLFWRWHSYHWQNQRLIGVATP